MADFTTNKVTGDPLTASEWNQFSDIDDFTLSSGQTPSTVDLNQLAKGVAAYVAQGGIFTTDSGVADAYVLTQISPFKAPHKLFNGFTVRFRAGNANTGACTVNAFTLGVKSIKLADGSTDPSAGDIPTTKDTVLVYDGANFRISGENIGAASTSAAGIVELLTDAELAAGTDTSRAATAAAIASLFGASTQGAESSFKIPIKVGGAFATGILKCGISSPHAYPNTSVVTFAEAFPTAIVSAVAIGTAGTNTSESNTSITSYSVSAITIKGGSGTSQQYFWFAIGY